MKLARLEVDNLFGMYDHVVDFNKDEHIRIIYGANGIGKTAILRMINAFFNTRYSELRAIPFSSFRMAFDDGSRVSVTKSAGSATRSVKEDDNRQDLLIEYSEGSSKFPTATATIGPLRIDHVKNTLRHFEEFLPGVSRFGPDSWTVGATGEVLSFEELIENFADALPQFGLRSEPLPLFDEISGKPYTWLAEFKERLDVRFIETQRLVSMSRSSRKTRYDAPSVVTPAVAKYSSEIVNVIRGRSTDYGSLSQELDRTFPTRVLATPTEPAPSPEELRTKFLRLEERRKELKDAGVIDIKQHHYLDVVKLPQAVDETTKRVLSLYIADVEKKLGIFDEVVRKIELLKQFITNHFLNKRLTIDKDRGFVLSSTRTGEELTPTQLSSGEQHELVLIYELLFRVKPDSLILIDEPEISLHVDWQLQFLEDIRNVINLTPFQVLIATHSPMIINSNWEFTKELVSNK